MVGTLRPSKSCPHWLSRCSGWTHLPCAWWWAESREKGMALVWPPGFLMSQTTWPFPLSLAAVPRWRLVGGGSWFKDV